MTRNLLFKTLYLLPALLFLFSTPNVFAQPDALKKQINEIIKTSDGTVGVAVLGLEDKKLLTVNPAKRFPMQSVYKFPLALTVLKQVDRGRFSLDQKIRVTRTDLRPNTWSPLRDDHPTGDFDMTLAELITYTVAKSDNNGCDILFRLMGGTKTVETYVHSLGVAGISIKATEEQMGKSWNVQYTNWSTPTAMLTLLKLFYERKILSNSSNDFLMKIMLETSTGPFRLKGRLPREAAVAHKTGTSGINDKGIAAATNDVGIVTTSFSKHFAIVVFVTDSTDTEAYREAVIAQISQAVFLASTEKSRRELKIPRRDPNKLPGWK